jgi:hypothetical protein
VIRRFGRLDAVRMTVAALALLLEGLGLAVGGALGTGLAALPIAIAVFALGFRFDCGRAAVGASYAACFTLTWNGWYVGPVRPGDVLILIALVLFVIDDPDHAWQMPPWWVKQLAGVIILVALLYILFPVSQSYLAHRVVLSGSGKVIQSTTHSIPLVNIGVAFKFIVAVAALPVAFVLTVRKHRNAVYWLSTVFVLGTALSGLAAFAGKVGFNQLTALITHLPPTSGRQFGFSIHPNFLAAGLVIAAPFAVWLLFSTDGRSRLFGAASLPFLVLGVYASGSRGGSIGIVLALAFSIVLLPRSRRFALPIAGATLATVLVVILSFPALGHKILTVTRLTGGIDTAGSDTIRSALAHQAILDLRHSPIWGIGLQVSDEAQNVYLQELASGGLLLFAAMAVYMFGGIITALRLIDRYHVAAAVAASLLAMLAINYVEADITDRFYYIPAAIIIALAYSQRLPGEQDADPPGAEPQPDPDVRSRAATGAFSG